MFCYPNEEHFDSAQCDNLNNKFSNSKSVNMSGVEDLLKVKTKVNLIDE